MHSADLARLASITSFFADVLQVVGSAEVDDITVEPDGTWRSDDDKFGTAQPKSKLPSRDSSVKPDIATSVKAEGSTSVAPEDKGKGKAVEALTLDSDDDDDEDAQPLAKRQRLFGAYRGGPTISLDSSPGLSAFGGSGGANGGAGGGAAGSKRMETIDLTLSDSEDDAPLAARRVPPAPAPAPAPIVNRAASHTNYAPPPPLPRPASAAGSASSGAGAAAPPPPPPPSNGMFAGGASAAETQEAMRRQMAEQALARHMADMRRRSELEREAEAEAEAEAAAAEDYGYEGEY